VSDLAEKGGQELAEIRRRLQEANEMILQGLRAPYNGLTAWWVSDTCIRRGHPKRRPDDPSSPCCCGLVK